MAEVEQQQKGPPITSSTAAGPSLSSLPDLACEPLRPRPTPARRRPSRSACAEQPRRRDPWRRPGRGRRTCRTCLRWRAAWRASSAATPPAWWESRLRRSATNWVSSPSPNRGEARPAQLPGHPLPLHSFQLF